MNSSSSKRIHFLSEQLANQIAAGEVVERPASVLKELLENALDAGATQIDVEVDKGGMVSLSVHDNGHGIHQDDMPLAISRHATSKIDTLDDLEALFSLGFRGEALASIGSVSRMKLVSRTAESEHAWSIEAQGRGSIPQELPATHPIGSSIEVRELFFNTPARRRFLRSEKTEFNHLEDVFKRAALSRPQVAFSLSHNQRSVHRYRGRSNDEQLARVIDVCGKAFGAELQQVEQRLDDVSLHGWVSTAREGRSSTDLQYFFLNGRMVRDKLIQHAIRQAYDGILPVGRHAAYVLYIDLPATEVDVNVHPTKHEVRFQQSRKIHDFIVVALRRHLPQVSPSVDIDPGTASMVAETPAEPYQRHKPLLATSSGRSDVSASKGKRNPFSPTASVAEQRLLAIIEERYILIQMQDVVRVLDCYQADALLIRHGLSSLDGKLPLSSPLIFPVQVSVSSTQMQMLESLREIFSLLQIAWERVDGQHIRISHVPTSLQLLDLQPWLYVLLEELEKETAEPRDKEALIEQMASAAMGKRRYLLNQNELTALLKQLSEMESEPLESGSLWKTLDGDILMRLMGKGS